MELGQGKHSNSIRWNKLGRLIYNNLNNVFYLDQLIKFDVTLHSHTQEGQCNDMLVYWFVLRTQAL